MLYVSICSPTFYNHFLQVVNFKILIKNVTGWLISNY